MQTKLNGLVPALAASAVMFFSPAEAQPPKTQSSRTVSAGQAKLPPVASSRVIGNVLYIEAPARQRSRRHLG